MSYPVFVLICILRCCLNKSLWCKPVQCSHFINMIVITKDDPDHWHSHSTKHLSWSCRWLWAEVCCQLRVSIILTGNGSSDEHILSGSWPLIGQILTTLASHWSGADIPGCGWRWGVSLGLCLHWVYFKCWCHYGLLTKHIGTAWSCVYLYYRIVWHPFLQCSENSNSRL